MQESEFPRSDLHFYIRPRFEAASIDAAPGAGREAECRYTPLAWENERPSLPYLNNPSLIADFIF